MTGREVSIYMLTLPPGGGVCNAVLPSTWYMYVYCLSILAVETAPLSP